MSGTLFVVGTPIGNLGDFSQRGIDCLGGCDFIAAEDTRVTVKLLNHFNIKKPMISYYEHNRFERGPEILARIQKGEDCALVTDAGMPAISDPGMELVRLCHEGGVNVASVPGPSAIIAAAAISGLDVSRFSFEGFLTMSKSKRREHLEELKTERKTMIFYEAPHKLVSTLKDLFAALGERKVAIIKELTKIHERVHLISLSEAAVFYEVNKPKGEYVIIIEAKPPEEKKEHSLEDAVLIAKKLLNEGRSASDSAREAARQTGLKKSDIYREII